MLNFITEKFEPDHPNSDLKNEIIAALCKSINLSEAPDNPAAIIALDDLLNKMVS
jgi:hypothetical protein